MCAADHVLGQPGEDRSVALAAARPGGDLTVPRGASVAQACAPRATLRHVLRVASVPEDNGAWQKSS